MSDQSFLERELRAQIGDKLTKWFGLGVVVAALPIIFNAFDFALRGQPVSLQAVTGRGELFLVSVAIVAAALAELPLTGLSGTVKIARTVLLTASVVLICLSTLAFAEVASMLQDSKSYNEALVSTGSICLFGFSMFTAACSIALGVAHAEVNDHILG
jgi:hypothetical protein